MIEPKRKAILWSADSIKEQSAVTPSDVERAKVFWVTNAKKEAKDILDAITE
jgi:hypothetical protein